MIDERTLADPTVCPSCANPLVRATTCPTCRVDLAGPVAARVWTLSVQAAELLAERGTLLDQLRRQARTAVPAGAVLPGVSLPAPARTPVPPPPALPPAPEWTRRRVQNLLLSLGVGLLAVAAVIFLVVSWSVLGVGGRAAVLVAMTALAGTGAGLAHRKGLEATAEAVSLLAVGLALLDAWGARNAGLAGLDRADELTFWAGALAVVAALAALTASVVPTRGLRVSAALLAQLPVPLLTLRLAEDAAHPAAVLGAGLSIATLLAGAAALAWPAGTAAADARRVLAGGAAVGWLAALVASLVAAYAEAGSVVVGSLLLLVLASVAAAAVRLVQPVAAPAAVAATYLVVLAAWAPLADAVRDEWFPAASAAAVAVLLAAAVLVPARRRRLPVLALLTAAAVPALTAVEPLGAVVAGQLDWLDRAWSLDAGGSAASRLVPSSGYLVRPLSWGAEVPVLLLVLAASALLVAAVHRGCLPGVRRPSVLAAALLLLVATMVAPVAWGSSFAVALAGQVAAGGLAALAGAEAWRRRERWVGAGVLAGAAALLTLATCWAFAAQSSTLVVLPPVAALLAAAAWRCGTGAGRFPRLSLAVLAATAALTEVGALARAGGAGWPGVWVWVLSVAAALAAAASAPATAQLRRWLVGTVAVALLGDVVAGTLAAGGAVPDAGLALSAAGAVGVVAACWLPVWSSATRLVGPHAPDVAAVAGLGAAAGVWLSASEPERLWLALLATGISAAVVALRVGLPGLPRLPGLPDPRQPGWAAGVLLTASSWVRLDLAEVSAPEPYTVPAGVALVALGALRRRREPTYPSWRAYATGLALALGPSLVRAVTDAGTLRPALLGLAALLVLGAGVARRLKAPLAVGGGVLAVDALVQLSPYLVAVYDAVPRWVLLAGAGLLLLGVGATYEQRAREVRALRHHVSHFG